MKIVDWIRRKKNEYQERNNIKKQERILHKKILENHRTKKSSQTLLFIPHVNCKSDGYDIINYKSDNVLCLFNNLLGDCKYNDFHFYLLYYDKNKIEEYRKYCEPHNVDRIHFILDGDENSFFEAFIKSSIIFTDETYRRYPYRVNEQTIVCLGYFPAPFKNDFISIEQKGGKEAYDREQLSINYSYDFNVTVSDLSSLMSSLGYPLYPAKNVALGFPRSDHFSNDYTSLRNKIIEHIGIDVEHIISYVPTHRDYENPERKQYNPELAVERTIWGTELSGDIDSLEDLLEDTKSLIIAKIHPAQVRTVLREKQSRRICLLDDFASCMTVGLTELLSVSDLMITDYTSAVFDYLSFDRPIIYYFYDIENYSESRGFTINPVESICVGDITYNLNQLVVAIRNILSGSDNFASNRKFLANLLIKYKDSQSTERVKRFFLEK